MAGPRTPFVNAAISPGAENPRENIGVQSQRDTQTTGRLRLGASDCISLGCFMLAAIYGAAKVDLPGWGTNDFIQYWSAYQLLLSGRDFYNPTLMLEAQQQLGWTAPAPQMMWNPPWLLLLLSPVLELPFRLSAQVWLLLNMLLLLFIVVRIRRLFELDQPLGFLLLLGLAFQPVVSSIRLGQIGLIIGAGSILLLEGLIQGRLWRVAVALLVLSVKPHLMYLVFLAVLWETIRRRCYRLPLYFFCLAIPLSIAAWYASPDGYRSWFNELIGFGGVTRISQWRAATLGHFFAALVEGPTGAARLVPLPVVIIPVISAVGLWAFLVFKRPKLDWRETFPPLAAASLATAPYGWIFDQVCLLTVSASMLSLAAHSTASRRRRLLFAVVGLHVVPICVTPLLVYHHEFFWHAPAFLLVWWWSARRSTVDVNVHHLALPRDAEPRC